MGRMGLGILVLAAGCGADLGPYPESPPIAPPPPPSQAVGLRLDPAAAFLAPGGTIHFHALFDGQPLAADQVRWSISDTSLGRVTSDGTLAATECWLPGSGSIRASLVRDTTRQAEAPVSIAVTLEALVAIKSVARAADRQPVDLANVSGPVEVTVGGPGATCREVVAIGVKVVGPAGEALLPEIRWNPAAPGAVSAVLRWDTAALVEGHRAFPNGDYTIIAYRDDVRGRRELSNTVPLRIANP